MIDFLEVDNDEPSRSSSLGRCSTLAPLMYTLGLHSTDAEDFGVKLAQVPGPALLVSYPLGVPRGPS
jgi:hypothetical protein